MEALTQLASKNPTSERLVPNHRGNVLRIKIVETVEGLPGVHVKFGHWKYVFGKEAKDFNKSPGIMVSCWWKCPSLKRPRISYEECRHWIDCYGKGFGSRSTADCFGVNVYTDNEGHLSSRPHPDIWTPEEELPSQQYLNKNFAFPLMRSMLEKRQHILTMGARQKTISMHKPVFELVHWSCTKRITTTGMAVRRHGKPPSKWGPDYFYSFSNEVHVDTCDLMTPHVKGLFRGQATTDYTRRLLNSEHACVYLQHVHTRSVGERNWRNH